MAEDSIRLIPDSPLMAKLERDEFDSDTMTGGIRARFGVVGAILKSQGAVIRDLGRDRNLGRYVANLFLASVLFTALYGAILGMSAPGWQILLAAGKVPIIVLGTALLCTPTFYVFNSILGSKFSFGQTLAAVLLMVASAALILVAFVPIVWFFTVTTKGPGFLIALHFAIFFMAVVFGMHSLNVARKYLDWLDATQTPINPAFLRIWFLIVLFVALQMAYYFRPLLEYGPFLKGERGLFFEVFRR